jgi:hypothetical protein
MGKGIREAGKKKDEEKSKAQEKEISEGGRGAM